MVVRVVEERKAFFRSVRGREASQIGAWAVTAAALLTRPERRNSHKNGVCVRRV